MSPDDGLAHEARGPIAYMARNGVAANLLMCFIVAAGLVSMSGLVQEAFPTVSLDAVEVSVAYPGATPHEVEESIVVKLEEQIAALEGVNEVTSVAAEGLASVVAELKTGVDVGRALDDVESAVGRIQTLPARAERPEIREMTNRQSVIRLVVYGDVPERALKELAYRIEDGIAALPEVSYVETSGVRSYEISIEVPLHRLRALSLTLEDISDAVRRGSLDLSAGRIETREAQVRVRTTGLRYDQQDFEDLVVLSRADGTAVRLGDVAEVRDGFQDIDLIVRYNGQRAAFVEVYRSSDEQVMEVVAAVEEHLEGQVIPSLPAGVSVEIWNNDAEVYQSRLDLLLENGALGLLLVLTALALFLEIRLAVWVAAGIGISFLGALAGALAFDVSINTISLFAFILAVGIVVDDAIVVAENVHAERQKGTPGVAAAIRGVQRVRRPLIFAVLTTVGAFAPLLLLPGPIGAMMRPLSIILISVLLVSLVESLLILPRHLAHLPGPDRQPANIVERFFARVQGAVDKGLRWFVDGPLDLGLRLATGQPAVVIAAGLGAIILSIALLASGTVGVIFIETVESDIVTANLVMPDGTPARRTGELAGELEAAGHRAIERLSRDRPAEAADLLTGVNLAVGARARTLGGSIDQEPSLNPQANIAAVEFRLLAAEQRAISAETFVQAWREEAGVIPEARSLTFGANLLDLGFPVHVELSHPDPDRLGPVAASLVSGLRELEGVFDVRSDHASGVQELQIELRPAARTLGLTLDALARQVRAAFFGDEALRVQRGREDVRVYVRLPPAERDTIADVEGYLIRTPGGGEVPLSQVAIVSTGRSPSSIRRKDGRRIVTVTADVDAAVITGGEATGILTSTVLPRLVNAHPGLTYALGGQQQQQAESFGALNRGLILALLAIYALLAIPFGSYTIPLIVMAAIPFGIVGAILGHLIMGIGLSATSMWGIIGLTGVVVNDSLVMIDFICERLGKGVPVKAAIREGAKGRFRPILLTSLTTFLGFAPLIFERSIQAQFLSPLGVSLGFGLIFATAILMLIVPALATVHFQLATSRSVAGRAVAAASVGAG